MPETPPFRWHIKLKRYLRANGHFVAWADVRNALDSVLNRNVRLVRGWNEALRSGRDSLQEWRTNMRTLIREGHLFATAAAKGGWAQLTQADYGRAGAMIKKEYAFLDRLALRLSQGSQPLDGNFQQYSIMYANAPRETYHQTERDRRTEAGYRYERNVRHSSDSCGGCVGASARGWVPIGTNPPIGARDCRRNCLCWFEYSVRLPAP